MRRLSVALLLAPAAALAVLVVGCTGSPTKSEEADEGTGKAPVAEMKELASTGWATLKGTATLDGQLPANIDQQNKDLLAQIEAKPADKDTCLAGSPAEKEQQKWRVKDGKVQYVVIMLRAPRGTYFKIDPDDPSCKEAMKDVKLDQPHCAFIPHVLTAFPSYYDPKFSGKKHQKPTGQKFTVVNSAKISHNTKVDGGINNPGGNPVLPAGQTVEIGLNADDSHVINVNCNIHTWMNGYIWALDHPYVAVTDENGTYEIKHVPAGAEVEVVAWHEGDWVGDGGSSGKKMTLKDGEPMTYDIKVKP